MRRGSDSAAKTTTSRPTGLLHVPAPADPDSRVKRTIQPGQIPNRPNRGAGSSTRTSSSEMNMQDGMESMSPKASARKSEISNSKSQISDSPGPSPGEPAPQLTLKKLDGST